ncbi:MAG: hypothetical protein NTX00_02025 [Candidatus Parcubacteria bacterium]|nr:hypothetical protein [Candidatus Parcubacteria bacterium]
MIIKYSDKFESIFYAILLSNITGNFLVSKNDILGLFENEEFLDMDQLNWRQILQEHDKKFGEIKWLNYDDLRFIKFKKEIDLELHKNNTNKYRRAIFLIKKALKFGLDCKNNLNQEKVKKESNKISPILIFDKKLI